MSNDFIKIIISEPLASEEFFVEWIDAKISEIGEISILPNHADFIAVLKEGDILKIKQADGDEKEIIIKAKAILCIKDAVAKLIL